MISYETNECDNFLVLKVKQELLQRKLWLRHVECVVSVKAEKTRGQGFEVVCPMFTKI